MRSVVYFILLVAVVTATNDKQTDKPADIVQKNSVYEVSTKATQVEEKITVKLLPDVQKVTENKISTTSAPLPSAETPSDKEFSDEYYDEDYDNTAPGDYKYNDDIIMDAKILFNEDKPCPRDCECKPNLNGYTTAYCYQLDPEVQQFGSDISALVLQNAKNIILNEFIFKKLGLTQLESFRVIDTNIIDVNPKAFDGLVHLHTVNLTNSLSGPLNPNTFANNKRLTMLSLSGNNLLMTQNSRGPFGPYLLNSSSIQELDLSNCNLPWLVSTTFQKLPNLFYINLQRNKISFSEGIVDSMIFASLLNLEEVDLSHNLIRNFSGKLFSKNEELLVLHLNNNPIEHISDFNLINLQILDLSMNRIKLIDSAIFKATESLVTLNISGNGITEIYETAFSSLVDLRTIDLSNNQLSHISPRMFLNNEYLDVIKMSNNPSLNGIPAFHTNGNKFTTYLFEARNCSLTELREDTFREMPAISQLYLSHNNLQEVRPEMFAHLYSLIDLDLSHNNIKSLHKDTFAHNKGLHKLNLGSNPLEVISATVFIPIDMLSFLDLSNCSLSHLWLESNIDSTYPKNMLRNLHVLNISKNRLRSVLSKELEASIHLTTLDITQNPLICNEDFEELMAYLGEHSIANANQQHIEDLEQFYDDDATEGWNSIAKEVCKGSLNIVIKPKITTEPEIISETVTETEYVEEPYDEDEDEDDYDDDDDDGFNDEDLKDDKISLQTELDLIQKMNTKVIDGVGRISSGIDGDENEAAYEEDIVIREPMEKTSTYRRGRYSYLWPILILIISVIVVLIIISKVASMCMKRRHQHVRYTNAIISAMNSKIVKKDSGLVYQQLSEDISGPKTPIISRSPVKINISDTYLSSPFHHEKITPEQV